MQDPKSFFEKLEAWTVISIPSCLQSFFDSTPCECGVETGPPTHVNIFSGSLWKNEHNCETTQDDLPF